MDALFLLANHKPSVKIDQIVMRAVLLLGFALCGLRAEGQTLVPGSTSPDGQIALFYQIIPGMPYGAKCEFYFRDAYSLAPLSDQLVPKEKILNDGTLDKGLSSDPTLLFVMIGSSLEFKRTGRLFDPGFSYFVSWSLDSRWVAIEGGAHKFWDAMILHRTGNRFRTVEPSVMKIAPACEAYFHAHKDPLQVQTLDVSKHLFQRNYDFQEVCWMDNGLVALGSFEMLFNDPANRSHIVPENVYFLVDWRSDPKPRVVGLAR